MTKAVDRERERKIKMMREKKAAATQKMAAHKDGKINRNEREATRHGAQEHQPDNRPGTNAGRKQ